MGVPGGTGPGGLEEESSPPSSIHLLPTTPSPPWRRSGRRWAPPSGAGRPCRPASRARTRRSRPPPPPPPERGPSQVGFRLPFQSRLPAPLPSLAYQNLPPPPLRGVPDAPAFFTFGRERLLTAERTGAGEAREVAAALVALAGSLGQGGGGSRGLIMQSLAEQVRAPPSPLSSLLACATAFFTAALLPLPVPGADFQHPHCPLPPPPLPRPRKGRTPAVRGGWAGPYTTSSPSPPLRAPPV